MIDYHINNEFNSKTYKINIDDTEILIDPGDEWEGFHNVSTVLLTHGHFDHIYGINRVIDLNPKVRIFTNEEGRKMLLDARKNLSKYHERPFVISDSSHIITINDRDMVELGIGLYAKAVFTPGHHPSCITWIIGSMIFTGDSYIPGIKTVTNLPHGNKIQAQKSLELITELKIGKKVYPGHSI